MKLKLITVLGLASVAAQAATNSTVTNYSLVTDPREALPIVDNAGNPIATADSSVVFGSFTDAFAATLAGLDTVNDDQAVIDAFTPSGATGVFAQPGMFNFVTQTDPTGSLGDAADNNGAYALITYTGGASVQALVISMGQAFPKQEAGNADLTLNRVIGLGDVVFGENEMLVDADTSALPAPFQPFTQGITFDKVVPEPSTGLLSLIAGLGLLARRRR